MIAAFFASIWGRIWPYLVAAGAAVVATLAIWRSGKSAGRKDARIDQLEADASVREKAREASAEIDRLDDPAVRDRAERWVRRPGR